MCFIQNAFVAWKQCDIILIRICHFKDLVWKLVFSSSSLWCNSNHNFFKWHKLLYNERIKASRRVIGLWIVRANYLKFLNLWLTWVISVYANNVKLTCAFKKNPVTKESVWSKYAAFKQTDGHGRIYWNVRIFNRMTGPQTYYTFRESTSGETIQLCKADSRRIVRIDSNRNDFTPPVIA